MVRRRNAEDINDLKIPAQAYRAMTVAEQTDRTVGWVVYRNTPIESTFERPISWRDRSRASWFQLGRDRS